MEFWEEIPSPPSTRSSTSSKRLNLFSFNHLRCLGGNHAPHVLVGFLSLLIYLPINFIYIALYFEPLAKKKSYSNRDNSNSLLILQLYQIAGMFFFSAFTKPDDDKKLLMFLIVGSAVLLNGFGVNNSFHENFMTKLWNWVAMVNAWSVMCLCISYVSSQ
jgi:fucose permease